MFVKPDGVRRGLVGEVVHRVERKGLRIVALRMLQADERLAGALYAEHEGKPFYDALVAFVTSENPQIDGIVKATMPWFVRPLVQPLFARHRV